jgi:hypothetical protein
MIHQVAVHRQVHVRHARRRGSGYRISPLQISKSTATANATARNCGLTVAGVCPQRLAMR